MKKPYSPKPHAHKSLLAMPLQALAYLLRHWFLVAIAVVIVSPISPHILWTYTYREITPSYRVYHACSYLGVRGAVDYMHGDSCPLVVLLDRSKHD